MDPMQADALRRAQQIHGNTQTSQRGEMSAHPPQERVNSQSRSTPSTSFADSSLKEGTFVPPSPRGERSAHAEQGGVNSYSRSTPSTSFADSSLKEGALFADKEKLLILSLILILSTEENSDPVLTLALLYLII